MPKYSKSDIRRIIRDKDFSAIIKKTRLPRDRFFLTILYVTGARPSEIMGDSGRNLKGMTWGDIRVDPERNTITFFVPVSKLKKNVFAVDKRELVLSFDPDAPDLPVKIIFDMIEVHFKNLKRWKTNFNEDAPLFTMSRKTGYNIVERAGKQIGIQICPYNFRHSRLTQLSEQGAGLETIMYFKGSKDIKSISPYLHARKIPFKLKTDDQRE